MEENKNQTIEKKEISCDNCEEEKPAIAWCENCGTYYCKDCNSNLHSGKATRNHLRISIKEKMKKPTITKCKSHMKDNEVYCVDCSVLICSMCMIDDHTQHQMTSIFKYGETMKIELKNSLSTFKETINDFNELETNIKEEMKKRERVRAKLKEKIEQIDLFLKEKKIEEEKNYSTKKKS